MGIVVICGDIMEIMQKLMRDMDIKGYDITRYIE